ncbi:odorant receptor 2a-like [Cydia strobilella]|uniref:odorant receptor 2a-like n=1 Tax=Cydia strobilella TaxID=1100964 RepID=UPI0030047CC4
MERWRTYSLEYSDLPTMVANVADLLKHMGLNIDGKVRVIPILSVIWTVISALLYLYVYTFSILWHVCWRGTGDTVADAVLLSLACASMTGLLKLFFLHFTRKRLQNTIISYLKFDERLCGESRMYRRLVKNLRVIKKRGSTIWIVLVVNGIFYCSMPLLLPGRHLMEDMHVIYGLEPMFETPNYEIAHILSWITVMLVVYCSGGIDVLLITLSGYVEAQMITLSDEMLDLWPDAQALTFEDGQDEHKLRDLYIQQQLEYIVQAHVANLALLRLTEGIFINAIAVEFCLLGVAMIAELLGGIENTYIQIPFAFSQVSMDCFIGQRLLEASERFSEAVYDCKWENFNASNMKTVLMILKNSRTMVISAGGVAELRYTSLMAIIKSIYSAYMALQSTVD